MKWTSSLTPIFSLTPDFADDSSLPRFVLIFDFINLTAYVLATYSAGMGMSPFNTQGDLPSGVHWATLAEVLQRFGHGAPERVIVTERLQRVIALAQGTGKLERVFIWGSDVTDKPDPGDIDLFLVRAPDCESNDYTGETRLVFDSATAERLLGATVFWMTSGAGTQTTVVGFLEQFQIRRDGGRRGLVEVLL